MLHEPDDVGVGKNAVRSTIRWLVQIINLQRTRLTESPMLHKVTVAVERGSLDSYEWLPSRSFIVERAW